MKFAKFVLPLLFVSSMVNAQTTYYGHKVGIDFNFIGRKPLFNRTLENWLEKQSADENIRYKGKRLEQYSNYDWGFVGGLTLYSRRKASFAVQFTYYKSDVSRNFTGYYYDETNDVEYNGSTMVNEDMKFKSMTIMPVLSLTSEELIKPIGLTHEFGVGFMTSSLVDKDYHFRTDGNIYVDQDIMYNKKHTYKSACIMYGLKLSKPISKNIVMNFGLRYSLIFGNTDYKTYSSYDNGTSTDVKQGLNRNYLNALFGFSLLL